MSIDTIHTATAVMAARLPVPVRLTLAYRGLEITQYALRNLAFLNQGGERGDPVRHVLLAMAALTTAPALPVPCTAPPPVLALALTPVPEVLAAVADLADTLVFALVETAGQTTTDPDRAACAQAAQHCSDLHRSLTEDK